MKALFIDPKKQVITETIYNGNYESIYAYLGDSCRTFDVARLYANQDCAFVDDEGLYAEDQHFWLHRNYLQPLAGNALILGTDDEGDSISPATSLEQLRNDVEFLGDRFDMALIFKAYGPNPNWEGIFFSNEKGAA